MAIIIKCTRGPGDCEGPSISDGMITSVAAAKARGKRWLDDPTQGDYYLTKKRTLQVPHTGAAIVPGAWVEVTCQKLGLQKQLVKVTAYTLTISKSGVWGVMDTEQYSEFRV